MLFRELLLYNYSKFLKITLEYSYKTFLKFFIPVY